MKYIQTTQMAWGRIAYQETLISTSPVVQLCPPILWETGLTVLREISP